MSENYTGSADQDDGVSPADRPDQNLPGMRFDEEGDSAIDVAGTGETEPNQDAPHESNESVVDADSEQGVDALTPLNSTDDENTDESATGGSSFFGDHGSASGGDGGTVR